MSRSGQVFGTNGYHSGRGLREKVHDGTVMTARRRLAMPFVLVCTLATLAACTGSGPSPTPSTPPATSPTGAPPPPSPAVTGHPAGIRCVSAQLTVSVGPGPNAAGHVGLLVG